MASPSVLLAGHLTHDRHGSGLVPGGCVFYAGEVYRRLGAELHIATTVGEDFLFDAEVHAASSIIERRGATTVFTNLYPQGQARAQLIESVAPPVVPDHLPAALASVDLVHLAPVMGEIDIAAWKRAVSPRLLAISVQGWVRAAGAAVDRSALAGLVPDEVLGSLRGRHVIDRPWEIDVGSLRGVDVACLSQEDLAGQGDLLGRLCEAIPLVVLTLGNQGCEIIERSTRRHVGIYATTEVEPTGAGDAFAAALLHHLALGKSPRDAARFGAAAASIVIEGVGGSALSRIGEAHERMAHVPA